MAAREDTRKDVKEVTLTFLCGFLAKIFIRTLWKTGSWKFTRKWGAGTTDYTD
jgi:hypothetical protein